MREKAPSSGTTRQPRHSSGSVTRQVWSSTGHRYDVLGEERFRRDAADYPVVVAPDVWCVADETAAAAMDYVRGGGTLVLTPGSLGKTYGRYRDSGLAAFAASGDTGAGRVVVLETGLGMEALAERLAPLLPPPELDVEIDPSAEFPCVERLLVGDARRKVLYLQNWGGLDHTCRVTLPEECRGWRVVPLEGAFSRTADGRLPTSRSRRKRRRRSRASATS